jgi:hypothetical protein
MLGNLWFLILGIIFQSIAMSLPIKWDTGSWRKTEKGKLYIDQYEQE